MAEDWGNLIPGSQNWINFYLERVDSFTGKRSSVWNEIETDWNRTNILKNMPDNQTELELHAQQLIKIFRNNPNFNDDNGFYRNHGMTWNLSGRKFSLEYEADRNRSGSWLRFQILDEDTHTWVIETEFSGSYYPKCVVQEENHNQWDFKLHRIFLHGLLNEPELLEEILSQMRNSYPKPK